MTQWFVKDLSQLSGISVQTLHHYDRIDLLKPSVRLPNSYRLYSEQDLLKLQQIIALKFFGFKLSQIKEFLTNKTVALKHFSSQAEFLEKKAHTFLDLSKALKGMILDVKDDKSMHWKNIIKFIEVYRMTQELEKSWAAEVFTKDELKQYASFEAELKTRFTPEDKKTFSLNWIKLIDQVRSHLHADPKSDLGVNIAKSMMDLVGGLYGKENANLKNSIWENGFKKGKMDNNRALESEVVEWLDKAIDHYYRERIYKLLDEVELGGTPKLLQRWDGLMEEMFGTAEELKQACYVAGSAQDDLRVGPNAKKWLQQFLKT